jgi:hypothetical protein
VRADDKYTRSIECVVYLITGGRIPTINDMTTDEYGLQSMKDIDQMDLRMSSKQWEKQGLMLWSKALDHASMYRTDLLDEKNAETMYRMFVSLPAVVITQGVSKIHEELSKFIRAEYFDDESNNKGGPLALLRGI